MATLKLIRRRIASVKSTQKATRAMKLVSAAKLRRAQQALANSKPYSLSVARIAGSLLRAPTVPQVSSQAALLVVVCADRGLCAGYNVNLLRKADEVMRELRGRGLEPKVFAVGRKALDHYKRTRQALVGDRINLHPRLASFALARELSDLMLSQFRAGEISEAGVAFSRFRSAVSHLPTYARVLPVAPSDASESQRAPSLDYLIEPDPQSLVAAVLQSYVESTVLEALLEAEASEHGARMTAMDSATNNASEMIERYTLQMNRARQAAITLELMDIVGGAEALRGQA